jgi:hypothetical protein
MKEAWSLFGIQSQSCPLCQCTKKDYNAQQPTFPSWPSYDYAGLMQQFEAAGQNWREKLRISNRMQKEARHYPVRVSVTDVIRSWPSE